MKNKEKDFCFCTLALGKKYRILAQNLAKDIEKYSPGTKLVILTDKPKDFKEHNNVLAFKHKQKGIFACFNDRRFVIKKALSIFRTAIHIDSDTRITKPIAKNINFSPSIEGLGRNSLQHLNLYRQKDIDKIKKIASKLNIFIKNVNWIGESLYIVTKDNGKEKEWIKYWGLIASYLELHGMHDGDGHLMGLAAEKIGWKVKKNNTIIGLKKIISHSDFGRKGLGAPSKFWEKWKKRIGYHYRLNKARLLALRDFNFYYR